MELIFKNRRFFFFVLKFILLYFLFYFTSIAIIGISSPGGYYLDWVDHYFNYVQWLKISLIRAVEFFSYLFHYNTVVEGNELIRFEHARGVRIAMSCLGIGVLSFWSAFVISDKRKLSNKLSWLIVGLFILWLINVMRILFFLFSINLAWKMPFGLDHHTWYNILAYIAIFIMIYFYEKSSK